MFFKNTGLSPTVGPHILRAEKDRGGRASHIPVLGDASLEWLSSGVSTSISEVDLGHSRKKQKRDLIS